MADRVEELNARIYDRFVPSSAPSMVFSPRPVPTKYVKQPIMDEYAPPRTPIRRADQTAFLPSTGVVPSMHFCVDIESTLKGGNLFYALQKDPRAAFVPKSTSDLYNAPPTSTAVQYKQPHPQLFTQVVSAPSAPIANSDLPPQIFYNTRLRSVAQTR